MSRSGYDDGGDFDNWALIKYRGTVASAARGKRGQAFFRDLIDALDAMPEKRLIKGDLVCERGVCALGALSVKRGLDVSELDPEDAETVAATFDIASPLAREVVYENDEGGPYFASKETPEALWQRMRAWAASHLKASAPVIASVEQGTRA